jgi:hypothetical protein
MPCLLQVSVSHDPPAVTPMTSRLLTFKSIPLLAQPSFHLQCGVPHLRSSFPTPARSVPSATAGRLGIADHLTLETSGLLPLRSTRECPEFFAYQRCDYSSYAPNTDLQHISHCPAAASTHQKSIFTLAANLQFRQPRFGRPPAATASRRSHPPASSSSRSESYRCQIRRKFFVAALYFFPCLFRPTNEP